MRTFTCRKNRGCIQLAVVMVIGFAAIMVALGVVADAQMKKNVSSAVGRPGCFVRAIQKSGLLEVEQVEAGKPSQRLIVLPAPGEIMEVNRQVTLSRLEWKESPSEPATSVLIAKKVW